MSQSFRFPSDISDNSTFIDHLRQAYIDLENLQDEEDIHNYIKDSVEYLRQKIPNNILDELITIILSCFKHLQTDLSLLFDDFFTNAKKNSNYILVSSSILAYLSNLHPQIKLTDYQSFVTSALANILPQIQNQKDTLFLFDHEIPNQFKNDLILNLVLSTEITEKLILDFLPYLFSIFLTKNDQKFELLIQKVSQSKMSKVLPQTDDSKQELFEFINSHDFNSISKMKNETFSIIETAFLFTKISNDTEIDGLSKETIFPFLAVVSVFLNENQTKLTKFSSLFDQCIGFNEKDETPILTASIDAILKNYSKLCKTGIILNESFLKVLKKSLIKLFEGKFLGNKKNLLKAVFDLSVEFDIDKKDSQLTVFFNEKELLFKLFKYCIQYLKETDDQDKFSNSQFNLLIFKSDEIIDLIQESDDIISTIYFIENYCINQPKIENNDKLIQKLYGIAKQKVDEKQYEDVFIIVKFFKDNKITTCLEELKKLNIPIEIEKYVPKEEDGYEEIIDHLLNSEEPEKNDEAFLFLFNKFMQDDAFYAIYMAFNVTKYTNKVYQLHIFIRLYRESFKKYQEKFVDFVSQIFYLNEKEKCLFRIPSFDYYSLPVPEIGTKIVNKIFNSIENKPLNYQAFICLKFIASTFPLLLLNTHQKVFNYVLDAFDLPLSIFQKKHNMNQVKIMKTAHAAFSFFSSFLILQNSFDIFVPWFYERMSTMSDCQIMILMNFFNHISNENLFIYVLSAYCIKLNFLEKVADLLNRKIENEILDSYYKNSIYQFLIIFYQRIQKYSIAEMIQIEEFTKIDHPFEYLYTTIFKIYPWCQNYEASEETLNKYKVISEFIKDVDKISLYSLSFDLNKIDSPNGNSSEIKSFMNYYKQNKFDKNDFIIPKIPELMTVKMIRYIVMKPGYIYSFFLFKKNNETVPPLYDTLEEVVNVSYALQSEIQDNPDDDENLDMKLYDKSSFYLPFYCKQYLLENLVKQVNNESLCNSDLIKLCDVLKVVCSNEVALLSVFQFIDQNVKSIYSNNSSLKPIERSIFILSHLTKMNRFDENFIDLCGNHLIDIVLSSRCRKNPSILMEAINLFAKINNNIPSKIFQMMIFGIITNDPKTVSLITNFYSKFDQKELEIATDLIFTYFNMYHEDPNHSFAMINIIKNIPSIIQLRRPNILSILDNNLTRISKLTDFDNSTINFILDLLNKIAPERGHSTSRTNIIEKSAIPEYILEESPIFWRFFEKHMQKIIEYIEQDTLILNKMPFLLNYPELLSFNIRSSYFRKKMNKRIPLYDRTRLNIDRSNLLTTSFRSFQGKETYELLKKFKINYKGEEGIDLDGISRNWFVDLTKEIFNQNYGLFNCTGKSKGYMPNSLSYINPNHLEYFKFVGKFIARALIGSQCIEAHLTSAFCKQILHREPNLNDLEDIDEEIFNSLNYIKDNDDVEELELVFAINMEELGVIKTIPLIENGENILVTNENKIDYIRLRLNYSLKGIIEKQVESFCEGFDSLISHDDIRIFTPNELDLLICGIPVIDVEDFRRNTVFMHPYTADTPVIKMFFNVISKWDNEKLAKLLLFMTGSSRVPSNGFREFCEMCGESLKIESGGSRDKLAQAHTCYNMLCLPQYESEEELNEKLLFAIQNANTFEFA